ncbi:MAG: ABC transporter substrate-binding protein [Eubacteriales bacterium]
MKNMKKTLAMLLASTMLLGALASCSSDDSGTGSDSTGGGTDTSTPDGGGSTPDQGGTQNSGDGVELYVVTSYGGEDGNRANYVEAVEAYEAATGNTVLDNSGTSNETWKSQILLDFQSSSEPDVLFFFAGVDANDLIADNEVVSIAEIREVYPDYASNMKDEMLPASPYDGDQYCIPVNGYWEGLFVNKAVLEAAGVAIPGADYTWDQFLIDCQTILDAGYTPIAASMMEVPHYWFEFTVLNNGSVTDHLSLPVNTTTDEIGLKWAAAIDDMKTLYDMGFLPRNTLTDTDAVAVDLIYNDEAAFLIDGSWKIGGFEDFAADVNNITVTYVPAKGDRVATEVIGGLSMGYYITRTAWENPETQAAAVEFITAMTTDEVVSKFGATAITALKNPTIPTDDLSSLALDAIQMTAGATFVVAATQDNIEAEARKLLFAGVKEVLDGQMTSAELLSSSLGID